MLSYGGLGEDIRVGSLIVRPIEVIEDTRCPVDVDCAWSGEIVLRLNVSGVGETEMDNLRPLPLPQGGELVLESVAPDRYYADPPPVASDGPYRFGFAVR